MKRWDYCELIEELEDLSKKGIHKGQKGLITKIENNIYTVWFTNPKNEGELAWAKVDKQYLKYKDIKLGTELLAEIQEFIENVDLEKYTMLTEVKVKEHDKVELLVNKPKYTKENVYKGAFGCVMQPYAIDSQIEVEFYNIEGHKYGCVELMVDLEDVKIVE